MRWKMIATMEKVTRVNEEEKLSVVSQFLQILSGSQAHKQVRVFFTFNVSNISISRWRIYPLLCDLKPLKDIFI